MKAIWNGVVIADSDKTIVVEGNHYFPSESIDKQYFKESTQTSSCPWKGLAHYYSLDVNEEINVDAAWYYPEPFDAAKEIKGYLAFWRGVEIVE